MEDRTKQTMEENEVSAQIISDDDEDHSISTINTVETVQEPVAIDIGNKMAIIRNVLKACMEENKENVYYYMDYIINRLGYLTKLPKDVLADIMKKTKETHILEESLLDTSDKDILIRRNLVKLYIIKHRIPKSEFMTHIVDDHRYHYTLDQQLKRSGYIWRRLPNTKRAIIVEHPKRVIERQRYLQKIINYRKDNRRIVYVEAKIVSRADDDIYHFQKSLTNAVNFVVVIIAVVNNNKRFLNAKVFFSKSIFKCQKLIEDHIEKSVITSLTEPSVIILEDKPYYRKSLPVPTIESEKFEMVKWLEINGLPHEKNLHRGELFALIQKCKAKSDLHKFDAILHAHGHEILRRPTKTDYLNYYKPLWDNIPVTEELTTFISKKTSEFWKNLEFTIIRNEKSVFYEDLKIENITDKILTMANNTDVNYWADLECDEEVDSLAQEEYHIEIKNSFSLEDIQEREAQFLYEIKKFKRVMRKKICPHASD